jgi:hypothetical protein
MDTFRSSKTAFLANRAYVDMSDDLSTEEEGISTQDEDEEVEGGEKETEEEEDPLMTFLQGCKPENMTLNECRDILAQGHPSGTTYSNLAHHAARYGIGWRSTIQGTSYNRWPRSFVQICR